MSSPWCYSTNGCDGGVMFFHQSQTWMYHARPRNSRGTPMSSPWCYSTNGCDGGMMFFHQSQTWMMRSLHYVCATRKEGDSISLIHSSLLNMKIQGLVDPQNKPFGRVLQIEIQVFIVFLAECFVTSDKRKEVNWELQLLPKCETTGYPQILGDNLRWNQVVFRNGVERHYHCYHCHLFYDHRLSVSQFTLCM